MLLKVLKISKLGLGWLLFLLDRRHWLLISRSRNIWLAAVSLIVSLSYEVLVIHSSLDNKQTGCYEGFLKELALEHFYEVLNSNVWLLFIC